MLSNYEKINDEGLYKNLTTGEEVWWTDIALDKAYDIIKDRKFPILIPTYNSPNPPAVTGFLSDMDEDYNYPIILFVRESQREDYVNTNTHPYVTVVSVKDELIDSLGKARFWSTRWLYNHGYSHAFVVDDDVQDVLATRRGYSKAGAPISKYIRSQDLEHNTVKVFALWQLAMETLERKYDNILITGTYPMGFSWKETYCQPNNSALLYRGNFNQVLCLNVKNTIENKLQYRDNRVVGHEDIDFFLQGLGKDLILATFGFLCYSCAPMDLGTFTEYGNTMEERMQTQQNLMREIWGDNPYVKFLEKSGYAQVRADFRRYRADKGFNTKDKYELDIWQDGKMLEDGYYEITN